MLSWQQILVLSHQKMGSGSLTPAGASPGAGEDSASLPSAVAELGSSSSCRQWPNPSLERSRPGPVLVLGLPAAPGGAACSQERARGGCEAPGGASLAAAPSSLFVVFPKPLPSPGFDRVTARTERTSASSRQPRQGKPVLRHQPQAEREMGRQRPAMENRCVLLSREGLI